MPTGTRSTISTNSATNPRTATASVLMPRSLRALELGVVHVLGMEDQPIGPDRNQKHGRDVANPGDREERPGRQMQVEGRDMVLIGAPHLVEQRPGLHCHHEQQHKRREHVDQALIFRADITPDEIDGDVGAAIARRSNAPENENAEQQAADVEGIGNRIAEQIAQQHRDEDVDGNNTDKAGRDPFDRVDEAIHEVARHVSLRRGARWYTLFRIMRYGVRALYLANEARSSASAASG